jgi:hypothetical protein
MSMSVSRSPRVLIVSGVAAAVALGGAGLAYASTTSSTSPSSATSTPAKSTSTAKKHKKPVEDLVTAVTATSLTADTPKGIKTFTLTSATTYRRGTAKVTEADIKAGEVVRIRTAKDGTTARAVAIAPAVITGYVRSASGSTLTVVDRSGLSHAVSTTGATYKKHGAAGQASEVTAGVLVHVQGFLGSDGATIDATTIGVR